MENHTAKHFVLQLGSLASLYLSLSFLLVLIFGLVNLLFPDAADSVWEAESASSMVRIGIAMTIVFFPAYLTLTRLVNSTRRKNPQGSYLGLTKWLIYLSLLVGGAALLVDLVVVIMTFLEGDVTLRFLLKAGAVVLIIGAAFYYYLLDARGHWLQNERQSITFGLGTIVVVAIVLFFGFANIETPSEVREQKIDETQLSDLREIQWRIQDTLALDEQLPESLDDLPNGPVPEAPDSRPDYTYELTEKGFKLCATFTQPSQRDDYFGHSFIPEGKTAFIVNPDNWQHEAGEVCFERVVKQKEE